MNTRNKIVATVFLLITSSLLCMDIFFDFNLKSYLSHIGHCIAEGIIVLMFSRELNPTKDKDY